MQIERAPRVLETSIEDEVILLSPNLTFFSLNESAAIIWDSLAGPTSTEEVIESVCAVYEVDRPTATAAVTATLDRLIEAGLASHINTSA